MNYSLIRKLLFQLSPETAHAVSLHLLNIASKIGWQQKKCRPKPSTVMGLTFPNSIGLAAGLDKNGDFIDALATLGFGFIEIGSITPRPQPGNPKPRLFRLEKEGALINRMGFNNKGVDYLVQKLKTMRYQGILGINIGKNRETPIERAYDDYVFVMHKVLPYASYITINISSPNTERLRELQAATYLQDLLQKLKKVQTDFHLLQNKYVPLVVKISPDLTAAELDEMVAIFKTVKIDGIIATNTTIQRPGTYATMESQQTGGLSGKPLAALSIHILQQLYAKCGEDIPIMTCGGILTPDDIRHRMKLGAQLFQIYTGLIYAGPALPIVLQQTESN